MSRGKHLSLEEAREQRALKQFAAEHPSETDRARFSAVLNAMATAKKPEAKSETSDADASGD